MQKHRKQNFFKRNGKLLKSLIGNFSSAKESVSSIIFHKPTSTVSISTLTAHTSKLAKLSELFSYKKASVSNMKRFWITGSYAAFSLFSLLIILYPMRVYPQVGHKYSIYSSTPLRLGSTEYKIYSKDARSQKINQVFKEYNCPLEGLGEVFVYEADKNNIPWWMVAAISFQESSCGKMTPEPGGLESYNAWGWAVYGDNVQSFDNWARGIETVSEYLHERFYSRGITEPCEIMKTYTPPSKGSWCEGVKHYGDEIQNYRTPQT